MSFLSKNLIDWPFVLFNRLNTQTKYVLVEFFSFVTRFDLVDSLVEKAGLSFPGLVHKLFLLLLGVIASVLKSLYHVQKTQVAEGSVLPPRVVHAEECHIEDPLP